MNIVDMLLMNHNRPEKKIQKLKGIVIHWTGNTNAGANAVANRNYFNTTTAAASSHYIVDEKQIVRCIPDDEIAYHVGAKAYTKIGNELREGSYSPNFFLLGIEMCVNRDGIWDMTYAATVELAAYLLAKHKMPVNNLYRHYDITGKDCPRMLVDEKSWDKFKADVLRQMMQQSKSKLEHWGDPFIKRLKELELITTIHKGDESVEWGEFAKVVVGMLDVIDRR